MTAIADEWLSTVFGYPVFRLAAPFAEQDVRRGERAFFYAKVDVRNVGDVDTLTRAGMSVVDVNVTFERTPEQSGERVATVRDAREDDREAVLDVAATSFVYSRFHLDPRLEPRIANDVKREWMRSYFDGKRGEKILVAEADGNVAGFLAVLSAQDHGQTVRVIDLIATSPGARRRGLGRDLVRHFLGDSKHADVVRVGTQAANEASIRLYEECGFRFRHAAFVLHGHNPGTAA